MLKENINGYALALFSLAIEENKLKNMKEDSDAVIEAISENQEIAHLLSSRVLAQPKRDELVEKAFKKVNLSLRNFIKIIFNKGQGVYIIPVLEKVIKLINEKENIKEGIVYTTEKLTKAQISKLEVKVSKSLGFKPTLKNKLDPSLIAGFKIIVGDDTIEDSIVSRLAQLKNKLLGREEN